jgi:hypothetical protein
MLYNINDIDLNLNNNLNNYNTNTTLYINLNNNLNTNDTGIFVSWWTTCLERISILTYAGIFRGNIIQNHPAREL